MPIDQSDRTIRRAVPEDAERLSDVAFRSKAYWGYSLEFMEACRDELTLSPDDVQSMPTYAAVSRGVPVGFYSLVRISAEDVELGHLFVEPESIGTGIGRELLDHAKHEARKMSYSKMLIPGDPNAVRFYQAAGGRVVGETPSESIPGRRLPLLHIDL